MKNKYLLPYTLIFFVVLYLFIKIIQNFFYITGDDADMYCLTISGIITLILSIYLYLHNTELEFDEKCVYLKSILENVSTLEEFDNIVKVELHNLRKYHINNYTFIELNNFIKSKRNQLSN